MLDFLFVFVIYSIFEYLKPEPSKLCASFKSINTKVSSYEEDLLSVKENINLLKKTTVDLQNNQIILIEKSTKIIETLYMGCFRVVIFSLLFYLIFLLISDYLKYKKKK